MLSWADLCASTPWHTRPGFIPGSLHAIPAWTAPSSPSADWELSVNVNKTLTLFTHDKDTYRFLPLVEAVQEVVVGNTRKDSSLPEASLEYCQHCDGGQPAEWFHGAASPSTMISACLLKEVFIPWCLGDSPVCSTDGISWEENPSWYRKMWRSIPWAPSLMYLGAVHEAGIRSSSSFHGRSEVYTFAFGPCLPSVLKSQKVTGHVRLSLPFSWRGQTFLLKVFWNKKFSM